MNICKICDLIKSNNFNKKINCGNMRNIFKLLQNKSLNHWSVFMYVLCIVAIIFNIVCTYLLYTDIMYIQEGDLAKVIDPYSDTWIYRSEKFIILRHKLIIFVSMFSIFSGVFLIFKKIKLACIILLLPFLIILLENLFL